MLLVKFACPFAGRLFLVRLILNSSTAMLLTHMYAYFYHIFCWSLCHWESLYIEFCSSSVCCIILIQGSAKNLPQSCTSRLKPGLVRVIFKIIFPLVDASYVKTPKFMLQCFFPQNVAQQIKTPLFLVNAAYDSWQVSASLISLFSFYSLPQFSNFYDVFRKC